MQNDNLNPPSGVRDGPSWEGKVRWGLWAASAALLLLVAYLVMTSGGGISPEAKAQDQDRLVIDECKRQVADTLLSSATREAHRYMCNGLRSEYVRKYGREP